MLSYGTSALVQSVTSDIFSDLLRVFPINEAVTIMAIATLQVIKPSIASPRLSTHYNRTFVSKHYLGAALSPNSVCSLFERLGKDGPIRRQFYQKRIDSVVSTHHIAIDGTLKQDTSVVNDLSAFSLKREKKGVGTFLFCMHMTLKTWNQYVQKCFLVIT
ncbi:MAG: hypothetical protein LBU04_06300 [Christensenellaceae bacterium]|jgi:hypothetical protein|nr:hypothetical protein [Christensenellaceae bacterium]